MQLLPWFVRKSFWDMFGWVKMAGVKPINIPSPSPSLSVIKPVPLAEAIPAIAIHRVLVCKPSEIPSDEQSTLKAAVYKLQVWLYSVLSPMQDGLPPIDPDPNRALRYAYTRLHRTKLPPPVLPAEYLGSPDLGSLAVRGPYACYTEKRDDGVFQWDLNQLAQYAVHAGLQTLGATVLFKLDSTQRTLRPIQIDTQLGTSHPGDAGWELAKKVALCTATTHLSLVRHFNGVHLIGGGYLAIATRNHLPATHPLCQLLWPFTFSTAMGNDIVTRGQMVRGGDFESIFSLRFDAMCQLFDATHGDYDIVVNDPEEDARKRQIRDAGFDTPTQANLEALFKPLHEHARRYLQIYYPDASSGAATHALRCDAAIGDWLDELNRLFPNGVAVTRSDVTFDSLARLLARFMYLETAQHEILGSFVWNYQLWTHRQPVRIYLDGRREPLDVYQRLVNANYNLCVTRRELMYDFSYIVDDMRGKAAFRELNRDLNALQEAMERQPWTVWKLYPKALKVNING